MGKPKFPNGLDDAMLELGMGPTALGRLAGYAKQNIDRWRKGERRLKPEDAAKIAPYVGRSINDLLLISEDEAVPLPRGGLVPLISWVSAGRLSDTESIPKNVRPERYVMASDLGRGEWIALRVEGDSMNLVAPADAIIFVNLSDRRLVENGFYVFSEEDGESTFKRYRGGRRPRLQPYSTNPDHETIQVSNDLRVVGRVRRTLLDL